MVRGTGNQDTRQGVGVAAILGEPQVDPKDALADAQKELREMEAQSAAQQELMPRDGTPRGGRSEGEAADGATDDERAYAVAAARAAAWQDSEEAKEASARNEELLQTLRERGEMLRTMTVKIKQIRADHADLRRRLEQADLAVEEREAFLDVREKGVIEAERYLDYNRRAYYESELTQRMLENPLMAKAHGIPLEFPERIQLKQLAHEGFPKMFPPIEAQLAPNVAEAQRELAEAQLRFATPSEPASSSLTRAEKAKRPMTHAEAQAAAERLNKMFPPDRPGTPVFGSPLEQRPPGQLVSVVEPDPAFLKAVHDSEVALAPKAAALAAAWDKAKKEKLKEIEARQIKEDEALAWRMQAEFQKEAKAQDVKVEAAGEKRRPPGQPAGNQDVSGVVDDMQEDWTQQHQKLAPACTPHQFPKNGTYWAASQEAATHTDWRHELGMKRRLHEPMQCDPGPHFAFEEQLHWGVKLPWNENSGVWDGRNELTHYEFKSEALLCQKMISPSTPPNTWVCQDPNCQVFLGWHLLRFVGDALAWACSDMFWIRLGKLYAPTTGLGPEVDALDTHARRHCVFKRFQMIIMPCGFTNASPIEPSTERRQRTFGMLVFRLPLDSSRAAVSKRGRQLINGGDIRTHQGFRLDGFPALCGIIMNGAVFSRRVLDAEGDPEEEFKFLSRLHQILGNITKKCLEVKANSQDDQYFEKFDEARMPILVATGEQTSGLRAGSVLSDELGSLPEFLTYFIDARAKAICSLMNLRLSSNMPGCDNVKAGDGSPDRRVNDPVMDVAAVHGCCASTWPSYIHTVAWTGGAVQSTMASVLGKASDPAGPVERLPQYASPRAVFSKKGSPGPTQLSTFSSNFFLDGFVCPMTMAFVNFIAPTAAAKGMFNGDYGFGGPVQVADAMKKIRMVKTAKANDPGYCCLDHGEMRTRLLAQESVVE